MCVLNKILLDPPLNLECDLDVTAGNNCPSPNGQISVLNVSYIICSFIHDNSWSIQIDETSTDTQAYVARDDNRKEIVTVYAGTCVSQRFPQALLSLILAFRMSTRDQITDLTFLLVPYLSKNVAAPCKYALWVLEYFIGISLMHTHRSWLFGSPWIPFRVCPNIRKFHITIGTDGFLSAITLWRMKFWEPSKTNSPSIQITRWFLLDIH